MTLAAGLRIGPYEVVAKLGAGGMGEVWRARDTRLARDVAIKVLPAALRSDPDRLRRFEQEARATGALSHPNLITVFDVGTHDGAPYLVTELLEGQTVRERLIAGAVPARRALGWAAQIARGLAAAHAKGVVHRDLKPDNLFVTVDDHVKILDFGIAKLTAAGVDSAAELAHESTLAAQLDTATGAIVGTPGYMAPEQLTGGTVDARADLFALGAVIYELLAARRPFAGDSAVEVSYAIVKHDPRPLPSLLASPAVERLILRCLEKRPDARFQSASDLAFALEALAGTTSDVSVAPIVATRTPSPAQRPRWPGLALAVVLGAAVAGGGVFVATRGSDTPVSRVAPAPPPAAPLPGFTRITYARRPIADARFSADGRSAYYSVRNPSGEPSVMIADLRSVATRALGVEGTLADVSATDELALITDFDTTRGGALSRLRLDGGAPRPVLDDVAGASFDADGELAVVHVVGSTQRVEYPIGNVLHRAERGRLGEVAVAPDGRHVAFVDHPDPMDTRGSVAVVDRGGAVRTLAGPFHGVQALSWSPDGRELWISLDGHDPDQQGVLGISLDGAQRPVLRIAGMARLTDVTSDGQALLFPIDDHFVLRVGGREPGSARELGWLDGPVVSSLTADGRRFVFAEGMGAGQTEAGYQTFVRDVDGGAPQPIGHAFGAAIFPDGSQVVEIRGGEPDALVLVPTGPGPDRTLPRGTVASYARSEFPSVSRDARTIAFRGNEAGGGSRLFVQLVASGDPRPVAEAEGSGTGHALSSDGAWVAALEQERRIRLYSTTGGASRALPGARDHEQPLGFTADDRGLFVIQTRGFPRVIDRVDLATGKRARWAALERPDPATTDDATVSCAISGDGNTIASSTYVSSSDLYLVTGLSKPGQ